MNHLFLLDMRNKGVDGARMELLLNDLAFTSTKTQSLGIKAPFSPPLSESDPPP